MRLCSNEYFVTSPRGGPGLSCGRLACGSSKAPAVDPNADPNVTRINPSARERNIDAGLQKNQSGRVSKLEGIRPIRVGAVARSGTRCLTVASSRNGHLIDFSTEIFLAEPFSRRPPSRVARSHPDRRRLEH